MDNRKRDSWRHRQVPVREEERPQGASLKRFPRFPGKPAHYERFVITVELGLGTRSESPGR